MNVEERLLADYLKFTCRCSRDNVLVVEDTQVIHTLIEITPSSEISRMRVPLNFALVLDRSGSMAGEKLHTMKQAVLQIIDQLDEQDFVSIVTFETQTEVLAASQPLKNRNKLKRQVEKIQDGGGTNVAPALNAALNLVSQKASDQRLNRIILLTDGEATDRESDSYRIADQAGAIRIPIVCLGFGKDWKEEFLFDIADRSIQAAPGARIGMADYIPSPGDAARIFQEIYQSMLVVAQDVSLTVRMVQGLEARTVWQVAPFIRQLDMEVIQGRSIQIPISNIDRSGAAFLIEIMLPPRPPGPVRIAQADVVYLIPEIGRQRQTVDVVINFEPDPNSCKNYDDRVMAVVEKVQAFRLQTQALDDALEGDVGSATRRLRQAVTILLSHGELDLADQMEQEAERLEQTGVVSSEGRKTILLSSRKTVRLSDQE